jgi:LPS-assembly lipoprotein
VIRPRRCLFGSLCTMAALVSAGCGFHLRQSAALPAPMQQRVYLSVQGGGAFARSLAAALRARKIDVEDTSAPGLATLSVPVATFSTQLLTTTGFQRVGEYAVEFHVRFTLVDADGKTVVPAQTIDLSHEFAVDQTQLTAIASETSAIQLSLVREMTDSVMRRLEAAGRKGGIVTPASASSG